MVIFFGVLALIFLIWNVIISIRIVNFLKAGGMDADLRWLRFKAYGYAKKYKEFTLDKEGKIGSLYYHFTISMILFYSALAIGIILAYLTKH